MKSLNFCFKSLKKKSLFQIRNGQRNRFGFCATENFKTTHAYNFIKANTTIKDLVYKEEILEYFAFNYLNLKEADLLIIILKMRNFQVLASEIKDIKCFFRDFLEISEKIMDEELKYFFIELFLEKMNDVNKNIRENQYGVEVENNYFDLDFSNILYSFMLFIERTIPICKTTKLFNAIFKSLNTFPYEDKNFSNEIWIKLIESYYNNEEINLIKTNLFTKKIH